VRAIDQEVPHPSIRWPKHLTLKWPDASTTMQNVHIARPLTRGGFFVRGSLTHTILVTLALLMTAWAIVETKKWLR
jgi:hypothetical protein